MKQMDTFVLQPTVNKCYIYLVMSLYIYAYIYKKSQLLLVTKYIFARYVSILISKSTFSLDLKLCRIFYVYLTSSNY